MIIGDVKLNQLLAIKRATLQHKLKVKLEFAAPSDAGKHELTLFFMCDSYLGCDQEYELDMDVQPAADMAVESD